MEQTRLTGKVYWTVITAGLFLWIYVLIRAIKVPLNHDEAATFYHYILSGKIWPGQAHWDANNHLLNSWLSYFSVNAFGESVFALRLPAVLLFGLYLISTFQLSRYTSDKISQLGLLSGLWGTHLILEFSGYCRGYGMSLALLATGLLFMLRHLKDRRWYDFFLMTVALLLGASANLTTLPVSLAIIILTLANSMIHFKKIKTIHWCTILCSLIITYIVMQYLANFATALEEKKLLYYGSDDLATEFIPSLLNPSLGFSQPWIAWMFAGISVILMVTVVVMLILKPIKSLQMPSWLMMAVYMAAVIAIVILHEVRGTRYPLDRTGLHILFLFVVASGFFPFGFGNKFRWSLWLTGPIFMSGALWVGSTNKQVLWAVEHMEPDAWRAFEEAEKNQKEVPIISGYHMRILTWSWLARHGNTKTSVSFWGDYPSPYADYLLAYPEDLKQKSISESNYDLLYQSNTSQITLYRKKERLERRLISDTLYNGLHSSEEFINLLLPNISPLEGKILAFELSGTLTADLSSQLHMVAMSQDTAGNVEQYHWQPIQWMNIPTANEFKINTVLYIGKIPLQSAGVKCYLWNIDKTLVRLENFRVKLISLENPN